MAEGLVDFALGNLCLALVPALVAVVLQRRGGHPALVHALWLVVLAKLVTPPLVELAVLPAAESPGGGGAVLLDTSEAAAPSGPAAPAGFTTGDLALFVWAAVAGFLAAWSLVGLVRFRRQLARASRPAPADVQALADATARRLGLARAPAVHLCSAVVTPFVWWIGGPARIVLPARALERLDRHGLRLVLAHELAHVRRRDPWCRWLEWLACVALWWNPLAWLARHGLRRSEEQACDLLVLQTLPSERRRYAEALLSVAELLATRALRPPAMASAMTRGGHLEGRLSMILSHRLSAAPRRLRSAVLALGLALVPVGVAQAQDLPAVERRLGRAVAAGEITLDQAQVMLEALRRSAGPARKDPAAKPRPAGPAAEPLGESLETRLKRAVERGELSPDEARKKLAAAREQAAAKRGGTDRKPQADPRSLDDLRRAEKELRARLDELKRREQEERARAEQERRDLEDRFVQFMKEAIERGDVTHKEALEKLEARRRSAEAKPEGPPRERLDLNDELGRIKEAVRRGELSREDAKARVEALRRGSGAGSR